MENYYCKLLFYDSLFGIRPKWQKESVFKNFVYVWVQNNGYHQCETINLWNESESNEDLSVLLNSSSAYCVFKSI